MFYSDIKMAEASDIQIQKDAEAVDKGAGGKG